MKMKCILTLIAAASVGILRAQEVSEETRSQFAVEARLSTYLQSGYDIGFFYFPKKTQLSVGALYASHNVSGNTKELLFNSSDFDALDMQLTWIVSLQTRYHFSPHKEGFFGELGIGWEEFQITTESITHNNDNGFVAPAVGYTWFPWGWKGFYVMPKVNGVMTLFAENEQDIDGTSYELKSFFFTPSFAIGWKF